MSYRLILLFCLFFIRASAWASDDPLTNFLDKLDSLQSDFTQTLINEKGQALEKTSGVLYMKQPGKFYWAYQQPYSQKIISDGSTLWIYDEDLEQVTIRTMGDSIDQTPAGIILGDSDLNKHFVQVEMGKIEGFDWVELTPRDPETQYRLIKLGFDQDNLGMMIIEDNLGQTTRIDFQSINRNVELDNSLFSLTLPEDV